LLAALPLGPAWAEEPKPVDPAERAKKVEEARRLLAEDRIAFQQRVDSAIDRGVSWLKTQQRKNGSFPAFGDHLPANTYQPMDLGVNAMVLLTLAKTGGLTLDDPVVKKLESWVRQDYAKMRSLKKVLVYPATEVILALDALYNRPPPPDPKAPTKGRDRYGHAPSGPAEKKPCKYPPAAHAWIQECVDLLKSAQLKMGGWRYPGNEMGAPPGDADMSNTQYALLGLVTAARCGIHVPADVYLRALEYLTKEQEKDGSPVDLWIENPAWEPGGEPPPRWQSVGKRKARGWCYLPGQKEAPTGSMTAGAVSCLAIVKERLGETGKLTPEIGHRIDRAMIDGLAWLGDAFVVDTNPVVPAAPAMWHYYYLYALERMGSLTGVTHLSKHDWYREGADHLCGAQEKNGSWQSAKSQGKPNDHTESEITQTCFALLFLERAPAPPAVPVTPPVLTGGPDDSAVDNRGKKDE
jgi:hypothetical protein